MKTELKTRKVLALVLSLCLLAGLLPTSALADDPPATSEDPTAPAELDFTINAATGEYQKAANNNYRYAYYLTATEPTLTGLTTAAEVDAAGASTQTAVQSTITNGIEISDRVLNGADAELFLVAAEYWDLGEEANDPLHAIGCKEVPEISNTALTPLAVTAQMNTTYTVKVESAAGAGTVVAADASLTVPGGGMAYYKVAAANIKTFQEAMRSWNTNTTKAKVEKVTGAAVTVPGDMADACYLVAVEYNVFENVAAIGCAKIESESYSFETALAAVVGNTVPAVIPGAVADDAQATGYALNTAVAATDGTPDYVDVPVGDGTSGLLPWTPYESVGGYWYGFTAAAPADVDVSASALAKVYAFGKTAPASAEAFTAAMENADEVVVAATHTAAATGLADTTSITGVSCYANAATDDGTTAYFGVQFPGYEPVLYKLRWTGAAQPIDTLSVAYNTGNNAVEGEANTDLYYLLTDAQKTTAETEIAKWTTKTAASAVKTKLDAALTAELTEYKDSSGASGAVAAAAAADAAYILAVRCSADVSSSYGVATVDSVGWLPVANKNIATLANVTFTKATGIIAADGSPAADNTVWYVLTDADANTLVNGLTTATTLAEVQDEVAKLTASAGMSKGESGSLTDVQLVAKDAGQKIVLIELDGPVAGTAKVAKAGISGALATEELTITATKADAAAAGKIKLTLTALAGDVWAKVYYRVVDADDKLASHVEGTDAITPADWTEFADAAQGGYKDLENVTNGQSVEVVTVDKNNVIVKYAAANNLADGSVTTFANLTAVDGDDTTTIQSNSSEITPAGTLRYATVALGAEEGDAVIADVNAAAALWTNATAYAQAIDALEALKGVTVTDYETTSPRLTTEDNGKYLFVFDCTTAADYTLTKYGSVLLAALKLVPVIETITVGADGTVTPGYELGTGESFAYYKTKDGGADSTLDDLKELTSESVAATVFRTSGGEETHDTVTLPLNSDMNTKYLIVAVVKEGKVVAVGEKQVIGVSAGLTFTAAGMIEDGAPAPAAGEERFYFYPDMDGEYNTVDKIAAAFDAGDLNNKLAFVNALGEASAEEKAITVLEKGQLVVAATFKTAGAAMAYAAGVNNSTKLVHTLDAVTVDNTTGALSITDATWTDTLSGEGYATKYYVVSDGSDAQYDKINGASTQEGVEGNSAEYKLDNAGAAFDNGASMVTVGDKDKQLYVVVYETTGNTVVAKGTANISGVTKLGALEVADVTATGTVTAPEGVTAANTGYYAVASKDALASVVSTLTSNALVDQGALKISFGSEPAISNIAYNGKYLLVVEFNGTIEASSTAIAAGVSDATIAYEASAVEDDALAFTATGNANGTGITIEGTLSPDTGWGAFILAAASGGEPDVTLTGAMNSANISTAIQTNLSQVVTETAISGLSSVTYANSDDHYLLLVKYNGTDHSSGHVVSYGVARINWKPDSTTMTVGNPTAITETPDKGSVTVELTGYEAGAYAWYMDADATTALTNIYRNKTYTDAELTELGFTKVATVLPDQDATITLTGVTDGKYVHVINVKDSKIVRYGVNATAINDGYSEQSGHAITKIFDESITAGTGAGDSAAEPATGTIAFAWNADNAPSTLTKANVEASVRATVTLYSDAAFTTEAESLPLTLTGEGTVAYIKVAAENAATTPANVTYYAVTIKQTAANTAALELVSAETADEAEGVDVKCGSDGATVVIKITDDTTYYFDGTKSDKILNWTVNAGETGLTLSSVVTSDENADGSGHKDTATLTFTGTAATGTLTVKPNAAAFSLAPDTWEPVEIVVGNPYYAVTTAVTVDGATLTAEQITELDVTFKANAEEYQKNGDVTGTFAIPTGYKFDSLTTSPAAEVTKDERKGTFGFTMPEGATTVTLALLGPKTVTAGTVPGVTIKVNDETSVDVAVGSTVTVTVTPDENYGIDTVSYTYNDGEDKTVTINPVAGNYSFEMPNYPTTVIATVVAPKTVTFTQPTGATLTVNDENDGSVTVAVGADVTVTYEITDTESYSFSSLSYTENGTTKRLTPKSGSAKFVMPAYDVTVTLAVIENNVSPGADNVTATTTADTDVNGDTVAAKVDDATADAMVNFVTTANDAEAKSVTLTIEAETGYSSVNSATVAIPTTLAEAINAAENTDVEIAVNTDVASFVLPAAALSNVQGSDYTLSASVALSGTELTAATTTAGIKLSSDPSATAPKLFSFGFGGGIDLTNDEDGATIAVTLDAGDYTNPVLYYVGEDGTLTRVDGVFEDSKLTVQLKHFSDYLLGEAGAPYIEDVTYTASSGKVEVTLGNPGASGIFEVIYHYVVESNEVNLYGMVDVPASGTARFWVPAAATEINVYVVNAAANEKTADTFSPLDDTDMNAGVLDYQYRVETPAT